MAGSRKIPMRTCCACGAVGGKTAFLRVVRTSEGEVEIDPTGKVPGRGAYLCREASCLSKARRTRRLERALRVTIDEDGYDRLECGFALHMGQDSSGEGTVG